MFKAINVGFNCYDFVLLFKITPWIGQTKWEK